MRVFITVGCASCRCAFCEGDIFTNAIGVRVTDLIIAVFRADCFRKRLVGRTAFILVCYAILGVFAERPGAGDRDAVCLHSLGKRFPAQRPRAVRVFITVGCASCRCTCREGNIFTDIIGVGVTDRIRAARRADFFRKSFVGRAAYIRICNRVLICFLIRVGKGPVIICHRPVNGPVADLVVGIPTRIPFVNIDNLAVAYVKAADLRFPYLIADSVTAFVLHRKICKRACPVLSRSQNTRLIRWLTILNKRNRNAVDWVSVLSPNLGNGDGLRGNFPLCSEGCMIAHILEFLSRLEGCAAGRPALELIAKALNSGRNGYVLTRPVVGVFIAGSGQAVRAVSRVTVVVGNLHGGVVQLGALRERDYVRLVVRVLVSNRREVVGGEHRLATRIVDIVLNRNFNLRRRTAQIADIGICIGNAAGGQREACGELVAERHVFGHRCGNLSCNTVKRTLNCITAVSSREVMRVAVCNLLHCVRCVCAQLADADAIDDRFLVGSRLIGFPNGGYAVVGAAVLCITTGRNIVRAIFLNHFMVSRTLGRNDCILATVVPTVANSVTVVRSERANLSERSVMAVCKKTPRLTVLIFTARCHKRIAVRRFSVRQNNHDLVRCIAALEKHSGFVNASLNMCAAIGVEPVNRQIQGVLLICQTASGLYVSGIRYNRNPDIVFIILR